MSVAIFAINLRWYDSSIKLKTMKKAFLFSALLFLSAAVFAQFTIGPKIGVTMSKLKTTFPEIKEEMKTGFQFGAFARIGKKLYIQPEVMFSTGGGKIKTEGTDLKTTVKLNSVQIPVLVGFKLLNLKVVNFRIMGGPAVSIVTNKEIEFDDDLLDPITTDNIKDGIWTFQLGAGVDVLMFALDVRYEWGLNNIYDPPSGADDYDMKNNVWTVSLGWKIL
jgi:hypothetical protein